MIEGLKPYAEYKESGLPWASRIPAHWSLIPNRAVLRKRKVLVGRKHKNYQLLSLTKGGVIVRDISTGKGKFSSDMGTSQEVRKGDFVFCLFDVPETPRTVGLSMHDGMITSAYTVFESPKLSADGVRYFERFYLAMDDQKLLSPLYSGLRHTIPPSRFLGTKTPQPPPDEQAAIVRFLDHANRKIDGFIRAKRKLIGLLNEQKQAIIHRAVTRGLHPDVPLKPSGIPWLGDIPQHWDVRKLRRVAWYQEGPGLRTWQFTQTGIQVICVTNITESGIDLGLLNRCISKEEYSQKYKHFTVQRGDVLLASSGNSWGKVAEFTGDETLILNTSTIRLDVKRYNKLTKGFLKLSLQSDYVRQQLQGLLTGSCQPNFGPSHLDRVWVVFPPDHAEQESILKAVEGESAPLTTAIARTEREIALMQEYRTRLTADLVTGKLDVRAAAAKLPEPPAEPAAEEALEEVEAEDTEIEEE